MSSGFELRILSLISVCRSNALSPTCAGCIECLCSGRLCTLCGRFISAVQRMVQKLFCGCECLEAIKADVRHWFLDVDLDIEGVDEKEGEGNQNEGEGNQNEGEGNQKDSGERDQMHGEVEDNEEAKIEDLCPERMGFEDPEGMGFEDPEGVGFEDPEEINFPEIIDFEEIIISDVHQNHVDNIDRQVDNHIEMRGNDKEDNLEMMDDTEDNLEMKDGNHDISHTSSAYDIEKEIASEGISYIQAGLFPTYPRRRNPNSREENC
jgi:hypothetical protein